MSAKCRSRCGKREWWLTLFETHCVCEVVLKWRDGTADGEDDRYAEVDISRRRGNEHDSVDGSLNFPTRVCSLAQRSKPVMHARLLACGWPLPLRRAFVWDESDGGGLTVLRGKVRFLPALRANEGGRNGEWRREGLATSFDDRARGSFIFHLLCENYCECLPLYRSRGFEESCVRSVRSACASSSPASSQAYLSFSQCRSSSTWRNGDMLSRRPCVERYRLRTHGRVVTAVDLLETPSAVDTVSIIQLFKLLAHRLPRLCKLQGRSAAA